MGIPYDLILKRGQKAADDLELKSPIVSPRASSWVYSEETRNLMQELTDQRDALVSQMLSCAGQPSVISDYEFRLLAVKAKTIEETLATIERR